MKLRNFSPVVVSLLVGAAIGYCFGPSSEPSKSERPEPAPEPAKAKIQSGDAAEREMRALRLRIKELEAALANKAAAAADKAAEAQKVDDAGPSAEPPRPRFDPGAEMNSIRNEDPARYAQITNNMAQFRRRRLERAQSKIDYLSSLDTSKMSPGARKTHEELQDMIEKREILEERMQGVMGMAEDERRALFGKMREMEFRIRELNLAERDNLLVQAAESLGFAGDDAREIAEAMKDIYEATDSGFGPPRGHGRDGRHGGRGGNR